MSKEGSTKLTAEIASEVNIDKQRLGAVYAKALLGATEARNSSESVLNELDALIDQVLRQSPDFESALASPRILPTEKATLLDRTLDGRVSESLLDFLKVVARHGRLDCIRHIRTAARAELNRIRQRLTVIVTTAQPLADGQRNQIRDQLQVRFGQQIDLQCQVDSDLLGGLMVRIGDTIYDGSISNELSRMKRQALEQTYLQLRESIDRFAVTS